jgi:hypothetical protein
LSKQTVDETLYSLSAKPPQRPDRRCDDRYVSLLRVGALLVDARRELCLIRNISAGGMMIRPYSPIAPGTHLSVELKQDEGIEGVAQWSDNGLVGITFNAPIDVVALLSGADGAPRPRMPRIELGCTGWLRDDGDLHRIRVLNISQGGIGVAADADLRLGSHAIVSLTGLPPSPGVIKWRDGNNYGVGFNNVLPVGDLMQFLQREQQVERQRAAG